MNDFERVLDCVDIQEVVKYYGVTLNNRGKAKCVFHHEKTASFSVSTKKQIFCCFGCGKKGNAIKFVQEMFRLTPYEAMVKLATDFNIEISSFRKDKNKNRIQVQKELKEYSNKRKSVLEERKKKEKMYDFLYDCTCTYYRFYNRLKSKCSFEHNKDELNIIYRNLNMMEYVFEVLDNTDVENVDKVQEELFRILLRGIFYMDIEKISILAYNEEEMPKGCSSTVELLTYYMLKDLYNRHFNKKISEEDAKKEKKKIEKMYEQQTSLENFYCNISKKINEDLSRSEDLIYEITKMINEKKDEKDVLPKCIECISKMSRNSMLQAMYDENYKST